MRKNPVGLMLFLLVSVFVLWGCSLTVTWGSRPVVQATAVPKPDQCPADWPELRGEATVHSSFQGIPLILTISQDTAAISVTLDFYGQKKTAELPELTSVNPYGAVEMGVDTSDGPVYFGTVEFYRCAGGDVHYRFTPTDPDPHKEADGSV